MSLTRLLFGAISAILPRATLVRVAMMAFAALLPASGFAYWLTPTGAVADPNKTYRLEWGGNGGNSGAYIQVQAPGSSNWETSGYSGSGNSSGVCNRSFATVGTWKAQIVSVQYGGIIDSTTFYVAPNTIATSFTFGNLSYTYDGNTKTATVTPTPSNAQYTSSLTSSRADAGSYTVTATGTAPYTGSGLATLVISPANTTFSVGPTAFTYNGNSQGPTINKTPNGATWVVASGQQSAVLPGTYSVTATAVGNYTGTSGVVTWTIVPATPGGLTASGNTSGHGFTFGWGTPSDTVGVTLYEVSRDGASLGTTGGTSLAINGLADATTYAMAVRGRDASGNWSAWSNPMNVRTPDVTPPSIPGGLSSSGNTSGHGFTLSWGASSDNVGVTAYEVSRNGSSLGTTAGTSMSIGGLADGVSYSMAVRACDAAGNWSSWSGSLLVGTPDVTAPSSPTGLSYSGNTTGHSFTLIWGAASDNVGATAYEISRDGASLGTTGGTSMSIGGLDDGVSYAMSVRACDAAGNWSGWSGALQVGTPDVTPPSIPGGLSCTGNTTGHSFTLNWVAASDKVGVTAYEVSQNSTSLGTTGGTTMESSGLADGVSYAMAVRACDAAGNWSGWSGVLTVVTPDVSAPAAPTGLSAAPRSVTYFWLNWSKPNDNVGATDYEVELNGTSLGCTGGSLQKKITGLSGLTTYSVRVRARDAAGNWSPWSEYCSATTGNVYVPTREACTITNNTTGTSFTINWVAPSGYAPDVSITIAGYKVWCNGEVVGTTTHTYMDVSGREQGKTYQMQLQAYDTDGNWSDMSQIVPVTTPDLDPPTSPSQLSASDNSSGTSFTLHWDASTDNVGVTRYEVARDGSSLGITTGLSMAINGLAQATSYAMKVRASDAAGNWSAWSNPPLSITTPDVSAPSIPTGLSVSGNTTGTSFAVSWNASTDNVGVAAYEVRRDSTSLGTCTGTSLSVSGLSQVTTYSLRARACDAAGNWSDWSGPFSVTTPDVEAPSAPAGLNSPIHTGTTVGLSWTPSTDNVGVTGYKLYRSLNGNTTEIAVGLVTSFTDVGLAVSANYSYTVKAFDAAGNLSPASGTLAVTTQRDPLADDDHDGIPNWMEQLLKTDPDHAPTPDGSTSFKVHKP